MLRVVSYQTTDDIRSMTDIRVIVVCFWTYSETAHAVRIRSLFFFRLIPLTFLLSPFNYEIPILVLSFSAFNPLLRTTDNGQPTLDYKSRKI